MNKKILVVEDEHSLASALDSHLQEAGFLTRVVYNGKDALEVIEREKFDMVLLDILMPEVDGWEVLKRLTAQKTRTIIITNLNSEDDRQKGKTLGAEEFIVKANISLEDLVKNVVALLEQKFKAN
jgi:DNA-binding response OmpR family regulator